MINFTFSPTNRDLLLNALSIYNNAYEGKGDLGRSSYLMSAILQGLGREEDARNTKALAQSIRQDLLGIPPDDDDYIESYDSLVGILDQ